MLASNFESDTTYEHFEMFGCMVVVGLVCEL
jgi:hypothetical protein